MKRNGFTMVELIFVIIIIGILSVAAIPKFGDIKDRAKVSTEYSALSSLDGAIEGAMEFQREDFDNIGIAWHGKDAIGAAIVHSAANTATNVLGKILKKNEALKVVAYLDLDKDGLDGATGDAGVLYDVIFIEGTASQSAKGVKEQEAVGTAGSGNGKPDKNDVWVFNTSPVDITITGSSIVFGATETSTSIKSGELILLDAKEALDYTAGAKIGINYTPLATAANQTAVTAAVATAL